MSTIANPPIVPPYLVDYQPRLFTAADLAAMPAELPSGPVRYELHHGRLITMPPPGDVHCAAELKVGAALLYLGEYKGLGKARSGEVGIVLARNPDHVFGAGAVFIANHRLPLQISSEGYLETIPDLVVEVRSKNDTLAALERKANEYLGVGVQVVWVVDPFRRNVIEYRNGVEARTYGEDETLTCEDIIPGFRIEVRQALAE